MRTYEKTHSALTFSVDLTRPMPELWMLLGEARSKIEHLASSPLKPEVAARLHTLFLAKGVLATTAIEGNTLTEEEVVELVEGRLRLPPSQEYLAREIQNIVHAFNDISAEVLSGQLRPLSKELFEEYNAAILDDLDVDEDVVPGRLRDHSVVVGRYRAAPAEDCEYLLQRLAEWLETGFDPPSPDWALPYAILRAIIAHLYLAWMHPFGDGNGRTARLTELRILLAARVATVATHLLSNHYNLTRTEYYRQLDRASRTGDPLPFITYAIRGFVDGLRAQLIRVTDQQFADRWEQYIYETFGRRRTPADDRRLNLVLALTREPAPVPPQRLRHLTPELAEAYAGTVRTLARDINALVSLGLIERVPRLGYRPRSHIIRSFMPLSAPLQPAQSELPAQ